MALFQKKESLTSNIAFMALMAAINIIFVLMSTFVPLLMFLLIFILPLCSTFVALYCNKKYFLIYLFTTVGLCMIVTFWNLADTFFYVIPSIFSGFAFAFLIERKVNTVYSIFISTIIYFIFTFIALPIINAIYGINMVSSIVAMFGLTHFKYVNYLVPLFIYLLSLIQSTISTFFMKHQLPKLGYQMNDELIHNHLWVMYLIDAISFILLMIFIFFLPEYSLIFLAIIAYFSFYLLIELLLKIKTYLYIALGLSLVFTIMIFALCYQYVSNPFGIYLISVLFYFIHFISLFINYLFHKKNRQVRINK